MSSEKSAQNVNEGCQAKLAVDKGELPDLFARPGGGRISERKEWPEQAAAWREQVLDMEYGGLPPKPSAVRIETLSHSSVRWPGDPQLLTYRVHCLGGELPFSFCVQILFPQAPGRYPAIISGDGCWWYVTDDVARHVVESGCALVMFNRTEMAEDLGYVNSPNVRQRSGGLYDVYPGRTFAALSAWAWGYHRCVDLLQELPFIDPARIAISGHSRGGKTTLVAGASDERITLVNDNASGAGGSAAFRYVGDGGEKLDLLNVFPSWFGPGLRPYLGKEEALPFDQHCLLAAIAPRLLLSTYSLGDRWANPEGMVQCAWAAGEVYRFLGAPDNLAFHFRSGGHSHTLADWDVLLDFIGWKWQGREPQAPFNQHPYTHLRPAFSWKAPDA